MKFLTTLFFLLSITLGFSQELPPVTNFNPNQYNAGNQNWMISQGGNKNLYVANGTGLLEYNGEQWNLYPVPNNTIIRSVKAVGEKIFTGAYMEAGYWMKNEFGTLNYNSLNNKFPKPLHDGEQFWHIENLGEMVVFQSFEGLYLYDPVSDNVSRIATKGEQPITNLFKVNNQIYFQRADLGLFTIKNGTPQLIISDEVLEGTELMQLSWRENKLQLIGRSGGFYYWDGNNLIPSQQNLTDKIQGVSIYSAIDLLDDTMVIGTVENGMYHINKNGEILSHFNQTNGLLNNTVLSLFLDNEKNIWAGLDNGLSIINLNSPFGLFQDKNGKIGSVYTSYVYNNYLYLGTNQGLYCKRINEEEFKLIPETNGQVWSLQIVDSTLFCGHNNGTYVVNENTASLISDRSGTWTIKKLKGFSNVLIQGHYNGISFIKKIENGFENIPMLKNFPHSSKFIVPEDDGSIWIGNEHKGVFRISISEDLRDITDSKNYRFEGTSGITSSIFKFNDRLYYATTKDIFQYMPTSDEFSKENRLAEVLKNVNRISGNIVNEGSDKIWGFSDNSVFYVSLSPLNSKYNYKAIYLPNDLRNVTKGHENITRFNQDTYLLGTANGYLTFNESAISAELYEVQIDRVIKSTLNNTSELVSLKGGDAFHYKSNNINIDYSIPEFKKFNFPLYSYRLIGLSPTWSVWSKSARTNFNNLPHGHYEFQVRGKIGDTVTEIAVYNFVIARPWYLSYVALAVYVLLFLFIIYLVNGAYNKHHQKINEENKKALKMQNLEAEQKIVKLQNEQLEKEMASKNKELAVSTMSLIKKNEFLNSIKDQLKESDSSKVRSVIKTIDKDISEADNWNYFKEAFNNADKDFFKKMKFFHPDLTSNDLKLCAYLRLNLSSKEIAPLLNISVKSVEIKRYRLRKKMDLPRETNLVEYILAI